MYRLSTAIKYFFLGIALGDGTLEKLRMAFFLFLSRVPVLRSEMPTSFKVVVHDRPATLVLRRNFADPSVLSEVFAGDDYGAGAVSEVPDTIFDVGANIGFTAIHFKALYPDAAVYCFEPDTENFKLLSENIKGLSRVFAYNCAIGKERGKAIFYKSPIFHMRNSLIARKGNSTKSEVDVITLDDAFAQTGVSQVALMKFDIEGGEYDMFLHFKNFDRIQKITGELHPYILGKEKEQGLMDMLVRHYDVNSRTQGDKQFIEGGLKQSIPRGV